MAVAKVLEAWVKKLEPMSLDLLTLNYMNCMFTFTATVLLVTHPSTSTLMNSEFFLSEDHETSSAHVVTQQVCPSQGLVTCTAYSVTFSKKKKSLKLVHLPSS